MASQRVKAVEVESSLSERPEHQQPRRLADWLNPTQAQGQQREERSSSTGGSEVPGLQLHERTTATAANCAAGDRALEATSPGLTRRTRGVSIEKMVEELSTYLRGWRSYFGFCETSSVLRGLEKWLRRRLRAVLWKQWKYGRRRFAELRKRDIGVHLAAKTAGSARGPWRLANSRALAVALPNAYFDSLGLPRLVVS